ncbi:hypothetical protein WA1_20625 [Scytonema hofmannii PCC 7110]|uniref:Uncharacterized protein n=2 Tax=Scytonema hofmannii TaxID=34078 RepID=A0A139XCI0_9CYAN|nr:hypothetical protein WA1_20625 [Scytonema hofmannii PCC 7110]
MTYKELFDSVMKLYVLLLILAFLPTLTMNSQTYHLQSENFSDETESIKHEDQRLVYERFRVIAKDTVDGSYYIGRIQLNATQADYFCWCHSCTQLNPGIFVDGCLSESLDVNKRALLVIR